MSTVFAMENTAPHDGGGGGGRARNKMADQEREREREESNPESQVWVCAPLGRRYESLLLLLLHGEQQVGHGAGHHRDREREGGRAVAQSDF